MNHKLNCYLAINSTGEARGNIFEYSKHCETCGIKNVKPPNYCKMWQTTSAKYQHRKCVTLNAHAGIRGGDTGLFAEKFVCVDEPLRRRGITSTTKPRTGFTTRTSIR